MPCHTMPPRTICLTFISSIFFSFWQGGVRVQSQSPNRCFNLRGLKARKSKHFLFAIGEGDLRSKVWNTRVLTKLPIFSLLPHNNTVFGGTTVATLNILYLTSLPIWSYTMLLLFMTCLIFLPTKVKLVVWTLSKFNIFTW